MNTTWEQPIQLPDGHRLFDAIGHLRIEGRGLTAIADNSGDYPQDTDDGVLWLDFSKSLMLGEQPTIPTLDGDSEAHKVLTTPATIMCLSEKYRWSINVYGVLFRAMRL